MGEHGDCKEAKHAVHRNAQRCLCAIMYRWDGSQVQCSPGWEGDAKRDSVSCWPGEGSHTLHTHTAHTFWLFSGSITSHQRPQYFFFRWPRHQCSAVAAGGVRGSGSQKGAQLGSGVAGELVNVCAALSGQGTWRGTWSKMPARGAM
jgi:hypothetical protein